MHSGDVSLDLQRGHRHGVERSTGGRGQGAPAAVGRFYQPNPQLRPGGKAACFCVPRSGQAAATGSDPVTSSSRPDTHNHTNTNNPDTQTRPHRTTSRQPPGRFQVPPKIA